MFVFDCCLIAGWKRAIASKQRNASVAPPFGLRSDGCLIAGWKRAIASKQRNATVAPPFGLRSASVLVKF
eukprot:5658139-Heterocapsa_arctica.AAC.1